MTWNMWWQMKMMDLQVGLTVWAFIIVSACVVGGIYYLVERFKKDI